MAGSVTPILKVGDIIILSLTAAIQGLEEKGASNQEILDVVFGGDRPKGPTNKAAILMPVRPFNLPWDPYMESLPHF